MGFEGVSAASMSLYGVMGTLRMTRTELSIRRIGKHYLGRVGQLQDASTHSDHATVWIEDLVRITHQRNNAAPSGRLLSAILARYQLRLIPYGEKKNCRTTDRLLLAAAWITIYQGNQDKFKGKTLQDSRYTRQGDVYISHLIL